MEKMNNELDEMIREKFTQDAEPLPESYEERVESILDELPEDSVPKGFVRYYWKTVAAIMAVILAVTAPAAVAGVKSYIAHLNQMEPEELVQMHDGIQHSQGEADGYSRELLPSERERMKELRESYKTGLYFPERELMQVKTEKQRKPGEFCFCYENSTSYVPETEMNEEQLRQIVDFQYRRDFALEKANEDSEGKQKSSGEDAAEPDGEIGQQEVFVKIAADTLASLYDIQTDGAACETEEEDGQVCVQYAKKDWSYDAEVRMDKEQRKILCISLTDKAQADYQEGIPVKKKEYRQMGAKIRGMAGRLVPDERIQQITVRYTCTENNTLAKGIVTYYVEVQDGSGYQFVYNMNTRHVSLITYVPDLENWIKGDKEQSVSMRKRGMYQKWMVLD